MTLRCRNCNLVSRQVTDKLFKEYGFCKACRLKLTLKWNFPDYVFVLKQEYKDIIDRI